MNFKMVALDISDALVGFKLPTKVTQQTWLILAEPARRSEGRELAPSSRAKQSSSPEASKPVLPLESLQQRNWCWWSCRRRLASRVSPSQLKGRRQQETLLESTKWRHVFFPTAAIQTVIFPTHFSRLDNFPDSQVSRPCMFPDLNFPD